MYNNKRNQIVDLKGLISDVITGMSEARKHWGDNTGRITNRETQIASKALKLIHKKTKARGALAPRTINRYITKVRTAIKVAGFVNPSYTKSLGTLGEKNARYKKRIDAVIDADYKESKALLTLLIKDVKNNAEAARTAKSKRDLNKLHKELKNKCLPVIDPKILSKLVRSDDEHEERKASASKLIELYQDETSDTVFSYSEIIKLIPTLLAVSPASKNGWAKLALGIALATGRRSIEVIYKSKFAVAPNRTIKITGFAKKKNGLENISVTVPCLASPALVVDAVNRMRNHSRIRDLNARADAANSNDEKSEIINNSVHAQTADTATDILGKLLQNTSGNILEPRGKMNRIATLKTARDLYINCAFIEYKKSEMGNLKIDAFTRNNLNHELIGTALSYQKFQCSEEVSTNAIKKAQRVKSSEDNRLDKLQSLAASDVITSRKPFVKAMNFIIGKVRADVDYIASTATLRKAIEAGKDENGNMKYKPICKTAIVGELVVILKEHDLDLPA